MPNKPSDSNFKACIKGKHAISKALKEMVAFLIFNFFPSLNKLLIHSHEGNAPGKTLANGLKTIECACNNITSKVNTTFCYAYGTLNGTFYEALGWLVHDLPGALRQQACEYVRVSENCY